MPPEIVLATSVDRKAPTTLSTAAINTAVRGRSAPVATEVAIAFALSWKAVGEIEEQGRDDDDGHQEQGACHAVANHAERVIVATSCRSIPGNGAVSSDLDADDGR